MFILNSHTKAEKSTPANAYKQWQPTFPGPIKYGAKSAEVQPKSFIF